MNQNRSLCDRVDRGGGLESGTARHSVESVTERSLPDLGHG